MFSPAGRKRTAAARPGHVGQRAGAQAALQRARDRALAVVEAGVGDRDGGEARELVEDRAVARAVLAPGDVDDVDRPELAAAVGQLRGQPRRLGAGRGRAAAGEVAVSGRRRALEAITATRRAIAGEDPARRVGGELQDLLDGHRGVDRDGGVRELAQLLDVVVLEPRDLLDLGVAAVDALEGRQALAQEGLGGLQRGVGRGGGALLEHAAQRRCGGPRRGRARSGARRRPRARGRRRRPGPARRGRADRPRRRWHSGRRDPGRRYRAPPGGRPRADSIRAGAVRATDR